MALPFYAALLGSLVLAATTGSEAGMAGLLSTQAAALDAQLRFSRQNEQEADRIGMQTLVNAGMDPRGTAEMFEIMQQRSEEHTSELQSRGHLVCRLLLEKKKTR